MTYKTRPGVVLIEVCGVPILVATREIWSDFPIIRPLPGIGSLVWKLLDKGCSWPKLLRICSAMTLSSLEETEPKLKNLCDSLVKDGLLLEFPDEDKNDDEV